MSRSCPAMTRAARHREAWPNPQNVLRRGIRWWFGRETFPDRSRKCNIDRLPIMTAHQFKHDSAHDMRAEVGGR